MNPNLGPAILAAVAAVVVFVVYLAFAESYALLGAIGTGLLFLFGLSVLLRR